eukprot:gene11670-13083_t
MILYQLSVHYHVNLEESEDIIRRCMMRASTYQLNDLVSTAAILLSTLKIRQSKNLLHGSNVSTMKGQWSSNEIWHLLNYSLHGETSLILQYANSQHISSNLDEPISSTNVSNAAALLRQHQSAAAGADNSTADHPALINKDYISRYYFVSIVLAEYWLKQGDPLLAGVTLQRALKILGKKARPLDLLAVVTKLFDVRLNLISKLSKEIQVDRLERLLASMHAWRLFFVTKISEPVLDILDSIALKALIYKLIQAGDRSQTRMYAKNLAGLLAGADWTAQTSSTTSGLLGVPVDYMRLSLFLLVAESYGTGESHLVDQNGLEKLTKKCESLGCEYILREDIFLEVSKAASTR